MKTQSAGTYPDIKAIIVDLGNVIIDISFDQVIKEMAKISGKSFESLKPKFKVDKAHKEFERGNIDEEAYRIHWNKQFDVALSETEFYQVWNAVFLDVRPQMLAFLTEVRKQYRIVLLSNTNESHHHYFKKACKKELALFEKLFYSFEMGCRKPELIIFEKVLDYLKLDASHCLFLDDSKDNVIASEQAGIKGMLITDFPQMVVDLKNIGIDLS